MIFKLCLHCGVECWHNPCGNVGSRPDGRCTFCGHPANSSNNDSEKRAYVRDLCARQVQRARILGLAFKGAI